MPRIPLCIPKPGESEVADQIRQRRHPRDLISLDGVLLHNPGIAKGWNELLGAIRSGNSLAGRLREALILRVAALNSAAYEWIQHEKVGRSEGLTTNQLLRIRDTVKLIDREVDSSKYSISPLILAGLDFADEMTRSLSVNDEVLDNLKSELVSLGSGAGIDRMILDATATVAGYNMVSRVLVTLDVADDQQQSVPIPGLETASCELKMFDGTKIHVRKQFRNVPDLEEPRPWLVFCNSLLTNLTMWDLITPSLGLKYNLICFDQRGHGKSSIGASPQSINQLADDVSNIVKELNLSTPVHGIIGVSQGGATALAVSARHPQLFTHVIACDTQPRSPPGNREAWKKRIELSEFSDSGPRILSDATVKRWFPIESHLNQSRNPIRNFVRKMIEDTSIDGFKSGAASLYDYLIDEDKIGIGNQKILLLAGERDGALPQVLESLYERLKKNNKSVQFQTVQGAGHLPMVDQPLNYLKIVEPFLES